jgi:hypothetical protein
MTTIQPGDVLAVRGGGWAGRLIRFGAAIRDQPNLDGHIAVAHHTDSNHVLWCIEARPGGVGWRDATDYLTSRWTISNAEQPKTSGQRAAICATMTAMLGTPYDWAAIAADAGQEFGLATAWCPDFKTGTVPTAVVCSSLAAYAYAKNGLPHPPGPDRAVEPAGWDTFILTKGWETPAP